MKLLREKGPAYLEKDLKAAKNDFEVRRAAPRAHLRNTLLPF